MFVRKKISIDESQTPTDNSNKNNKIHESKVTENPFVEKADDVLKIDDNRNLEKSNNRNTEKSNYIGKDTIKNPHVVDA